MSVLFLLGCAVSSLGNLLTGLAWTLAAAFTLQLLRGVGLSAMDVGVNTVVQRQVPAAMTGRVFGTLCGAVGAAAAISYLAGAALLETTGPASPSSSPAASDCSAPSPLPLSSTGTHPNPAWQHPTRHPDCESNRSSTVEVAVSLRSLHQLRGVGASPRPRSGAVSRRVGSRGVARHAVS